MRSWLLHKVLLLAICALLLSFGQVARCSDVAADVEKIMKDIRQDQPLPKLDYLKKTRPMNVGSDYYNGRYNGIEIAVENHPHSNKVSSLLIKIRGPNQTRELLPTVSRIVGKPHHSNPKKSNYFWEWKNYRSCSLHYEPGESLTIVSLFYQ